MLFIGQNNFLSDTMRLTVLIPMYNEERTVGKVIGDIKSVLGKTKFKYTILAIDDGSTDRSAEVARKAGAKVFSHSYNRGLASAFRTAIEKGLETRPDIMVHTDADGQYLAEDIPKLIKPILDKEADLVLGSRFMGDIEHMPFMKKWGNRAFSRVISRISGVRITDGQTGFRAFTKDFAQKVKIISNHTYTQEMIIRAVKAGFRVREVPVYFARRREGQSKLISNPFEYALKAWINIFRVYRDYEPLRFFGVIGAVLFSIGFLMGLYVLISVLYSGIPVLDTMIPSILVSVLFLVSGIQILMFGFLADRA